MSRARSCGDGKRVGPQYAPGIVVSDLERAVRPAALPAGPPAAARARSPSTASSPPTSTCGSASASRSPPAPASSEARLVRRRSTTATCRRSAARRSSSRRWPTCSAGTTRAGTVTAIVVAGRGRRRPPRRWQRRVRARPARPACRPAPASRRRRRRPRTINDALGSFLTPMLLALAGAALLVGALHHLQHLLDHRRPARRASSRCCARIGATRRQIVAAVTGEALVLGAAASVARHSSPASASRRALGALFDAVGLRHPAQRPRPRAPHRRRVAGGRRRRDPARRAGPRAARHARRARRRARRGAPPPSRARTPLGAVGRRRPCRRSALALLLAGAVRRRPGDAPHGQHGRRRCAAVRRPRAVARAGSCGRSPPRWAGRSSGCSAMPGRLARENAQRNPARTASTSAALMVGLGLVVFVAVFAAGLKASVSGDMDELIKADYVATRARRSSRCPPAPAAGDRATSPGVRAVLAAVRSTASRSTARPSTPTTDTSNGVDPVQFRTSTASSGSTADGPPDRRPRRRERAGRGAVRQGARPRARRHLHASETPSGGWGPLRRRSASTTTRMLAPGHRWSPSRRSAALRHDGPLLLLRQKRGPGRPRTGRAGARLALAELPGGRGEVQRGVPATRSSGRST